VPQELIVCQLKAAQDEEEAMYSEAFFQASNLDSTDARGIHNLEADFIEMCCPQNSTLAAELQRCGKKVIRMGLHNDYDFSTTIGADKALNTIRQTKPDDLWVSFPCGATSTIQRLNEITEQGRYKSWMRKKKQRKIIRNGLKCLRLQLELGGHVHWEWPRYNDGWGIPEVRDFFRDLESKGKLFLARVDGCMVGVEYNGIPMEKPWLVIENH